MVWRAVKNALAGLITGLVGGILLLGLLVIWGSALISLIDGPGGWEHATLYVAAVVLIPVVLPWLVQGLTLLQRSRLLATLDIEIVTPARTTRGASWSAGPWLATGTWRQLGYHVLALPAGIGGVLLAFLFPVCPGLARWSIRTDERLARLLGPTRRERLAERVESLARSRADLVAAADAERRRIERDLHDGAQQRLVSLAMNLGMARERFGSEPEPVRAALAAAHDEAMLALTELREFIRGLYPAVLSDRGLDAALSGLAARAPLPIRLRVDVPEPAAPGVEAVAYFIVSEAITNVVKHAQATQAEVTVTRVGSRTGGRGSSRAGSRDSSRAGSRVGSRDGDLLRLTVTDDGRGGAAAGAGDGTGLRGLAQRAAAVDGTLTIDSPPGGPTTITAELPCES